VTCAVRPISLELHREYVASRPNVSFLQVPEWGAAKPGWGSRSIGWFEGTELVGAGLVLSRSIPKSNKWLAYLPEGPDLPWSGALGSASENADNADNAADLLDPLLDYLDSAGAFLAKIGPTVPVRRWHATTLKSQVGEPGMTRLRDVAPDATYARGTGLIAALQGHGWTQRPDTGAGFGDVQPRYVFQVPLRTATGAALTESELFAGFNQLWRRNIRKANKAGVDVVRATKSDLARFHPVYVETARRDAFIPRGLDYFEQMWDALNQPGSSAAMALYLAIWREQVVAATTMITVGDHAWYSYGASANEGREVRPSNAIQWQMMRDSLAAGASVYDLRGITDTIDESDPHFGLIRFKLGTGGDAVEYVGEWDYALRPALAKAFDLYLRRWEIKGRANARLRTIGHHAMKVRRPNNRRRSAAPNNTSSISPNGISATSQVQR